MTYRTLLILSAVFTCIPLAGELFLLFSTGKFNTTIFAALGIAVLLTGNLIALKFHKRLVWAQLTFCVVLSVGVAIAIANDGGISSPLWFFQLLLVFGSGYVFGIKGVLVQSVYTLAMAITYYLVANLADNAQALADFTSVVASVLVFTAISLLYEREKEKAALASSNLLVANEELRQFAYRTSHDLKSPIIAIRSLAELIREDIDGGDLEDAKQIATRIIKRANSLERLIVDILNLAKADIVDVAAEAIDLASIVEQIIDRLPISDKHRDTDIQLDFKHTGRITLPDARVTQVLENLISNAIRYQDPTESMPFVKIASVDKAEGVEITVTDNGLGIDKQHSDRLFQMFQRFHPDVTAGSGLGLYIVKKHLDRLGAHIQYQRTDDGSRFSLMLNRAMGK